MDKRLVKLLTIDRDSLFLESAVLLMSTSALVVFTLETWPPPWLPGVIAIGIVVAFVGYRVARGAMPEPDHSEDRDATTDGTDGDYRAPIPQASQRAPSPQVPKDTTVEELVSAESSHPSIDKLVLPGMGNLDEDDFEEATVGIDSAELGEQAGGDQTSARGQDDVPLFAQNTMEVEAEQLPSTDDVAAQVAKTLGTDEADDQEEDADATFALDGEELERKIASRPKTRTSTRETQARQKQTKSPSQTHSSGHADDGAGTSTNDADTFASEVEPTEHLDASQVGSPSDSDTLQDAHDPTEAIDASQLGADHEDEYDDDPTEAIDASELQDESQDRAQSLNASKLRKLQEKLRSDDEG